MRTRRLFLAIGIFATSSVASAQECAHIAQIMGREIQRFGSDEQRAMAQRAQLCVARYESSTGEQRAQIQGAYGLFSGGASGSDTQVRTLQTQECQDRWGTDWSRLITSSEVNRVSQAGADVVRACLAGPAFRMVDLALNGEAVVATYRYGGTGSTRINGVSIQPSNILSNCRVLVSGREHTDLSRIVGGQLPSGEAMTLTCTRAASNNSTTQQRLFDGGSVTVATDSASPTLALIAYASPPIGESDLEALRRQIAGLQRRLSDIEGAPRFVYRSASISVAGAQTIPLSLPEVELERGVSSENAMVRVVTIQIPGIYYLSGSVYFDEPINQHYKSCAFVITRNGARLPAPGAQNFEPHCHHAGTRALERGDRVHFEVGQAGSPNLGGRVVMSGHWISPRP